MNAIFPFLLPLLLLGVPAGLLFGILFSRMNEDIPHTDFRGEHTDE